MKGLVSSTENMPHFLATMVQSNGIGAQKPRHSRYQAGIMSFGHRLEMVTNPTITPWRI
jgi:hypothetical protein